MSVASRTNSVHKATMSDSTKLVQFKLLLPARLKERIADRAQVNRRSLSQEIVEALEQVYPPELTVASFQNSLNYLIRELEKTTDPDRRARIVKMMHDLTGKLDSITVKSELRHYDDFQESDAFDMSVIYPVIDPKPKAKKAEDDGQPF